MQEEHDLLEAEECVFSQFYELARKEIGALIVADEHPNIVRCFAMEEDAEFVYLALERCKQSLNDVLGNGNSGKASEASQFVSQEGQPTELCMRVNPNFLAYLFFKDFAVLL